MEFILAGISCSTRNDPLTTTIAVPTDSTTTNDSLSPVHFTVSTVLHTYHFLHIVLSGLHSNITAHYYRHDITYDTVSGTIISLQSPIYWKGLSFYYDSLTSFDYYPQQPPEDQVHIHDTIHHVGTLSNDSIKIISVSSAIFHNKINHWRMNYENHHDHDLLKASGIKLLAYTNDSLTYTLKGQAVIQHIIAMEHYIKSANTSSSDYIHEFKEFIGNTSELPILTITFTNKLIVQ